jgi:tRNA-modifying protein YgfZ
MTLRNLQLSQFPTATFDAASVPISFGNDPAGLAAIASGVALYDACHWGRIVVSDDDRLNFLHNQTTNNLKLLKPGQGCETVILTSTARTIDLAGVYVRPESVYLTVSPGMAATIMPFFDRFIFFADKVKLTDVTATTLMLQLIGPQSDAVITALGGANLVGAAVGCNQVLTIGEYPIDCAVGNGLALPGYTLIGPIAAAAILWETLVKLNAVPIGNHVWQQLRIRQGRPMPGQELTNDYNPLEAGLWQHISFDKGCYIGQETIARLDTYNGVKQQLWGFETDVPVAIGSIVQLNGDKVGIVTSNIPINEKHIGLAYVKTKAGGDGLVVEIGDRTVTLNDLPYLTRMKSL